MCFALTGAWVGGFNVINLKMNMEGFFMVINSVDSYIFYVWEVPMCLFLED